MAGTDTPWARLDQTFAFQGSDDDDDDEDLYEDGNHRGHYDYEQDEEDVFDGIGSSRKGSVMTITIGHEQQITQEQNTNTQQDYYQESQQHMTVVNNTHHRTATTSTTSTASTITPANAGHAGHAGHQRQTSQLSTQQQRPQQQEHQQHRPRSSIDELYATRPLPPVPQKKKLQKSASSRSLGRRPVKRHISKPRHQSQPSASSIASSVSSFNILIEGASDGGSFSLSSTARSGSVSAPTTLLRPAQSSAGWFSSAAPQNTPPRETSPREISPRENPPDPSQFEPSSLAPLGLPQLGSPPAHMLHYSLSNQDSRPVSPLSQPALMAPLALPSLKPRSCGAGVGGVGGVGGSGASSGPSSYSPSHLQAVPPKTAPHGDSATSLSTYSMNNIATSSGVTSPNNAQDDSSSTNSERRIPAGTAKHSSSLPSLSTFTSSSSSRLKPAATAPGKAVRRFMRMAGKAANSAKGAMKSPIHAQNNSSLPSIDAQFSSGTPSITVTTALPSPKLSSASSLLARQTPSSSDKMTIPTVRPTMVARRRSMSKIHQLTGLDVDTVSGGSSSGISTAGILRRSQSTILARAGQSPNVSTYSAATSAFDAPAPAVFSPPPPAVLSPPAPVPAPAAVTSPSIWSAGKYSSDEDYDDDQYDDSYASEDRYSMDEDSIRAMSLSSTAAMADDAASDTPDPAVAFMLRSLSQTSTQPPPIMPQLGHLGQFPSPPMSTDYQRTLLLPNRLHKMKRHSDPTMAPIIEHPDDTSDASDSASSRASSHYSEEDRVASSMSINENDEDASSFIPSRPAPVPVQSPSSPPLPVAASPLQSPMLSLSLFPPVPSTAPPNVGKHIPSIRLFPSSSSSKQTSAVLSPESSLSASASATASASAPVSAPVTALASALASASAVTSPSFHSPSFAPMIRKKSLPGPIDISNPWPTSPPPRPPPPPPLHPIVSPEPVVGESAFEAVAEKHLSGSSTASGAPLFRAVQWGDVSDQSRASSATPTAGSTANRQSLHARTKSSGSASESIAPSIATSVATSVANSSTSGSSALSSTVASTIASSSSRSAGFGSFSSASTGSYRQSYQMASPPMPPPPPPSYPVPPVPASAANPATMPMSTSVYMSAATPSSATLSAPSQSAFDEDDDDVSARRMAARMMKRAASRDSARWRPTALSKSIFRRDSSPGPSAGPTEKESTGSLTTRRSLSTKTSLSATTLLAAQRVAQATRKTVEAVSEGGSGSSSAARQHELEMEKWREDLRSRIRVIPDGGEGSVQEITGQQQQISTHVPAPAVEAEVPQEHVALQTSPYDIRPVPPIHEFEDGGMI